MARIRTIKPEFFRHEGLQDLEIANPGMYPMMVFEALWGHCDSKGRFEWKPRSLKLDILPFLPFDMAATLAILEGANMVRRYTVDGKEYGLIDSFEKHQRLSGKEATEGEKFPSPPVKQQGSNREIPESQEGKGKEEEGKGREGESGAIASPGLPESPPADPLASTSILGEICQTLKRSGVTSINTSHPTLLALIEAGATAAEFKQVAFEATKAGKGSFAYVLSVVKGRREDAAKLQVHQGPMPDRPRSIHDERAETIAKLTGANRNERPTANERDITGEAQRVA